VTGCVTLFSAFLLRAFFPIHSFYIWYCVSLEFGNFALKARMRRETSMRRAAAVSGLEQAGCKVGVPPYQTALYYFVHCHKICRSQLSKQLCLADRNPDSRLALLPKNPPPSAIMDPRTATRKSGHLFVHFPPQCVTRALWDLYPWVTMIEWA
jgi:hypothetical protein